MRHGLKRVSRRNDDALTRVTWDRLERLLADHYRAQGYEVDHVGTGGAGGRFDGGIDLKLRRGTEYVVVQVKHWNAYQVPHNDVHQLIGLMVNEGAAGAILITSGEFTKAAIEAATRHGHVELLDGQELRALLGLREDPGYAPGASLGGRIAVGIGEHIAHAALGRVAGNMGRDRRGGRAGIAHGIGVSIGIGLVKLAVAIVLFLILFAFARSALNTAVSGFGHPGQPGPAATKRSASAGQPAAARSSTSATPIATIRACKEVIDAASGTFINHCTRRTPDDASVRRAPAQADSRKRSAMDILSESTPEM